MIKKILIVLLSISIVSFPIQSNAATLGIDLYEIKKVYIKPKPKKTKVVITTTTVTESKPDIKPVVEQPISINNIIVDKIKQNAKNQISTYQNKVKYNNIKYIIDENISQEKQEFIKKQIDQTISIFSRIYNDKNLTIFLWTEKNIEWANKIHNQLYENNIPEHAKRLFNCNSASANIYNNNTFIIMCIQDDFPYGFGRGASIPHELVHTIQYQQQYFMYPTTPCWIIEGSASYYGEAIGLSDLGSKQLREHFARQMFDNISTTKEMIIKNPKSLIYALEDRTCGFFSQKSYVESGYLVGSIMTEFLVGIYGNEKMIDFYKSFNFSPDWKSNFKNTFEISIEDFYLKIIPHLESMI